MPNEKKTKRLETLLDTLDSGAVQPDELIQAIEGILSIINLEKERLNTLIENKSIQSNDLNSKTLALIDAKEREIKYLISELGRSYSDNDEMILSKFQKEIKRLEKKIPNKIDLTDIYADIEKINAGLTSIPTEITANPESIRNALELLQGDERLDKSAIRGLDETIKTTAKKYHNDGIGLVIRQLVAGSGITIDNTNQEYPVITSTGGGGGMSVETPSGTVNGSNTSFTATSTPKFIITDTGTYVQNFGFTLSGLNITMDLAPNAFIRSFY